MARAKKNVLRAFEDRSVTADAIVAHRRRVTTADLRHKLREIGAYHDADQPNYHSGADDSDAGGPDRPRELGPLEVLVEAVPKPQLVIAIGFTALIVVYKLGELIGRPRGPQIEVRKLTFPDPH